MKKIIRMPLKAQLFSLTNPVPFDGQDYEKQDGPSDQPLFKLQKKFRKIPLLVIYSFISHILLDQVC